MKTINLLDPMTKRSVGRYVVLEGVIGSRGYWYVDAHSLLVCALVAPLIAIAFELISGGQLRFLPSESFFPQHLFFAAVICALLLNLAFGPMALFRAVFRRKVGLIELAALAATTGMFVVFAA